MLIGGKYCILFNNTDITILLILRPNAVKIDGNFIINVIFAAEVSLKFLLPVVLAFRLPCAKAPRQKNFAGVWAKRAKA